MVILERHGQVNAALDQLLSAAAERVGRGDRPRRGQTGRCGRGGDRARGRARGVRGPAPARPAGRRARRDPGAARAAAGRARRPAGPGRRRAGRCAGARPGRQHHVPAPLRRGPDQQGHGVAAALIDAASRSAEGYDDLTVVAREELPATIRFWERQGFREIRRESPNVELRRPLRTAVYQAPDAEAMRGLGRSIAGQLAPGDLIVLTGSLGAGKTTFTQGLGAGLGVRGAVTSPTFVIARVHPSEVGRAGAGARRRLPARRPRRARRPRPRHLARARRHRRRVGRGTGRGAVRVTARGPRSSAATGGRRRRARRVEITPVGPRWHALSFRGLG